MKKTILLIATSIVLLNAPAQDQITNNGNLRLHPGATMAVFGNMANNGTFTDAGQMVTFCGTSAQNISGTSVMTFSHITLNNVLGLTLQQHLIIDNSMLLTAGPLKLNAHTVTINNALNTALTRTTGYVVSEQTDNSGKIKWKIGSDTSNHIYPFGTTAGLYIPFVLHLQSGNMGNVTVSTYHTATNNTPYPVTPILVTNVNNATGADNSANTVDRFWQIDKDGVSGMATITFTATAAEVGGISNLKAQRWNSTVPGWDPPLALQTATTNSVTVSSVSNFSPWTLSGNGHDLPIELLDFTATPVDNKQVDLNWTTASETNNDYFTVERSVDGQHFETVAMVDGAGNSNHELSYQTTDEKPYSGTSYYRLKQTDFDGAYDYSAIRVVNLQKTAELQLVVSPNPGNGSNLNIGLSAEKNQEAQLNILTGLGHKCYSQTLYVADDGFKNYPVAFANRIEAGVYIVSVTVDQKTVSKKWVVQ